MSLSATISRQPETGATLAALRGERVRFLRARTTSFPALEKELLTAILGLEKEAISLERFANIKQLPLNKVEATYKTALERLGPVASELVRRIIQQNNR